MSPRADNPSPPEQWDLSRQVVIWAIRVKEGRADAKNPAKKVKKHVVRWVVGGREHQNTYATHALADAERSLLIGYQQKGCAFDRVTGLPEPVLRKQAEQSRKSPTWFEHMCAFTDTKWPRLAPNARRSIADALATVTPALLLDRDDRSQPKREDLRELVYQWAAVSPVRKAGPPAAHLLPVLRWLEANTIQLSTLEERGTGAQTARNALDLCALKLDGTPAAPNTVARKRAAFFGALEYAVELGFLSSNPLSHLTWTAPKTVETVDRRSVANMTQGRALLAAVADQGEMGARLEAFFASMMYAALRPAEVVGLGRAHLASMPEQGWGELLLGRSTPRSGSKWTNSGRSREDRALKHRAEKDTRPVPAHPELVAILNRHVVRFGYGPGGRIFTGPYGGLIDESTYLPIWHRARASVLTADEMASPLAARPYDLRHMAVSTWLNAGVPATQVAEWAGHSVGVLLKVYAKCIVGQDKPARDRIDEAFRQHDQG